MTTMIKKILLLCLLIPATAMASFGAAGNKIEYLDQGIKPNYTGQGTVIVATQDLRPYILDGKAPPEFVGLLRGGFGNPFDVKTKSGHPLGNDISASIAAALTASGFSATTDSVAKEETPAQAVERLAKNAPSRIVIMQLRDWKSDTYAHTKLHYDVTISIYGSDGVLIDSITDTADQDLKVRVGFSLKPVLAEIASTYHEKLSGWLNADKVRIALGATPVQTSASGTTQ